MQGGHVVDQKSRTTTFPSSSPEDRVPPAPSPRGSFQAGAVVPTGSSEPPAIVEAIQIAAATRRTIPILNGQRLFLSVGGDEGAIANT
jgi:hypothetical protein